jgi:hypothetical protein
MGEMKHESDDVERLCQAVSPNYEPCDYPATLHCAKCGRWFCDAHAEDEEWHPSMLPGDEEAQLTLAFFTPTRTASVCYGTHSMVGSF